MQIDVSFGVIRRLLCESRAYQLHNNDDDVPE